MSASGAWVVKAGAAAAILAAAAVGLYLAMENGQPPLHPVDPAPTSAGPRQIPSKKVEPFAEPGRGDSKPFSALVESGDGGVPRNFASQGAPPQPDPAQPEGASAAISPAPQAIGPSPPPTLSDTNNPDLHTGAGQMLSMLQSTELGDDPTPFPDPYGDDETGNEDFEVSATNDIVIVEGESPSAERRKEAVAWAKIDIREYLKAGGRAKDALQELYAFQKECARLRTDAADDFREWLKENPTDEEVLSALGEFNKKLKAEGIKQLTVEEILPFEEEEEHSP